MKLSCIQLSERITSTSKSIPPYGHLKNWSKIHVMEDICTTVLSSESSCYLNVLHSSIISSISDVQSVTKLSRHDLIENVDTIRDRITTENIDSDDDRRQKKLIK